MSACVFIMILLSIIARKYIWYVGLCFYYDFIIYHCKEIHLICRLVFLLLFHYLSLQGNTFDMSACVFIMILLSIIYLNHGKKITRKSSILFNVQTFSKLRIRNILASWIWIRQNMPNQRIRIQRVN